MLDPSGALVASPNGVISGGTGDDTLASDIGGNLGSLPGNRIVGNVVMDGAGGNDRLISKFGNDLLLGGTGNDTFIWRPGAQSDRFEGGGGDDVAEVIGNGNNVADFFVIRRDPATPGEVLVERTSQSPFVIRVSQIEAIDLRPDSGNDTVVLSGLTGTTLKKVLVNGGYGDDVIVGFSLFGDAVIPLRLEGGPGNDFLIGGSGNDFLDGGHPGGFVEDPDTVQGGPGADVFRNWIFDEFPDFNSAEGDFRL
jgi:Ca2+-binding RTX toxin-like protein